MITCKVCNQNKDEKDFYPRNKSTCIECAKERAHKWSVENKERQQENIRKWNIEHREEINAKKREYNKKPEVRAKTNFRAREKYANDPKHRAKSLAAAKLWRQNHPEAVREISRRSRITEKNNNNSYGSCHRLGSIRKSARQRNIQFHIKLAWYREHIAGKPCAYCGDNCQGGMDRVDNSIGYEPDNCVPCCHWCNVIKFTHSVDEMIDHIIKILDYCCQPISPKK